jgi:hypothetical protein
MECILVDDLSAERLDLEKIERRRKRFLISCWHAADRESLALWDSYADCDASRRKVAVRFARRDLVRYVQFNDIRNSYSFNYHAHPVYLHGGVVYKNLINVDLSDISKAGVLYPAFRKELSFRYENEYRFVIEQKTEAKDPGYGYYLEDARMMDFKIIVNPLLDNKEYVRIHDWVTELGFQDSLAFSPLARWLKPEMWSGKMASKS